MPFTPFHLGPGAIFKAIGGDRFSFMIFGGANIVMDVEPLVRLLRGDATVHGMTHSVAGAAAIGLASAAIGRSLGNAVIRCFRFAVRPIGWAVAVLSALIATYSHVALDAIMHRDMKPLWPTSDGNGLLGILSVSTLHDLCVASGIVGGGFAAWCFAREV